MSLQICGIWTLWKPLVMSGGFRECLKGTVVMTGGMKVCIEVEKNYCEFLTGEVEVVNELGRANACLSHWFGLRS